MWHILNIFSMFCFLVELPPRVLSNLIIKMSEIEERLAAGCCEKPQVAAFVAAFHGSRAMVSC